MSALETPRKHYTTSTCTLANECDWSILDVQGVEDRALLFLCLWSSSTEKIIWLVIVYNENMYNVPSLAVQCFWMFDHLALKVSMIVFLFWSASIYAVLYVVYLLLLMSMEFSQCMTWWVTDSTLNAEDIFPQLSCAGCIFVDITDFDESVGTF